MASIFLETLDAVAGEPTRHVVDAPATIGRGAECDLRLDPSNRALSRVHLEVVAEADGVFVVNRASNAGTTKHDGVVLDQGARVAVPDHGAVAFSLFGIDVRVGRAGALSLLVTATSDAAPAENLGRHDLSAAAATLVRSGPPATVTAIAPDAWTAPAAGAAPEAQLAVYLDRGQPALVVLARRDAAPVTIDGAELTTTSAYLRPLETVAHAGLTLQLIEDKLDYRRCPTCATLNTATRATCRICGAVFSAEPPAEFIAAPIVEADTRATPLAASEPETGPKIGAKIGPVGGPA